MNALRRSRQQFECPVCGYQGLEYQAESGEICPSCGTQFDSEGFEDRQRLRRAWISKGMPWFSRGRMAPKNWNPYRQLIIAGHGSDLILHPRIDSDLEFRYAVDEAFA